MDVDVGNNSTAVWGVLEVVQHLVYLVHVPFGVVTFYAKLVTIRFADGASFVRPTIPNVTVQIVDVVALFLPNPKQFVNGGFESGTSKCDDGELFLEVVSVYLAKHLACVGGSAVVPASADILGAVFPAVSKDILHVLLKNYISFAHCSTPLLYTQHCTKMRPASQ